MFVRAQLCEALLSLTDRAAAPELWARLQSERGRAFASWSAGDRADNLDRAIECYESALAACDRTTMQT